MLNNAKFKLLLIIFTLCATSILKAQKFYFEPLIGSAATEYRGNNLITDSIRVITNGSDNEGIKEIRSIGLNVGCKISTRFDALFTLSFSKIALSYDVYNESPNAMIGSFVITKGGSQYFRDVQLGLRPRFALLNGSKIKIVALIESSVHLTFNIYDDFVPFNPKSDFKGQLPMVANVLNALATAPSKTFFSFSYGGTIYYKRISLTVKYTENISNTITSNLEVEGVNYPFSNNFNRLSFTLGYQFYFKKKKDKNLD